MVRLSLVLTAEWPACTDMATLGLGPPVFSPSHVSLPVKCVVEAALLLANLHAVWTELHSGIEAPGKPPYWDVDFIFGPSAWAHSFDSPGYTKEGVLLE
ncbi:hypothetical protein GQ54DRAFT_32516 [Martensiomyces pterosporus]|nr:hypothetical protein GQ54DRAFT_32516 [Martensiomyces pterosporus]